MEYKVVNGTSYHLETPQEVIDVLEACMKSRTRIFIDYGYPKTGESWGEVHDVVGYVGRSGGKIKIPILLYNSRSDGGCGILTNCILSIKESKGKKVLYEFKKGC